jgi:pyruvate dehydrogenase E2 component (dihydrolipoamide acetyltransferase)
MPIEILMPALSPTMTEGNLAKWLKKEGDKIKAGDVICEIETDKATMEVEAVDEGTLGKILIAAGTENVKVNELIALLLEDGEDKAALSSFEKRETRTEKREEKKGEVKPQALQSQPLKSPISNPDSRIKASPLAKRIAAQEGVNLAGLQGTGPNGRIVKDDVLNAPKGGSVARIGRNPVEATQIPNNNMRKVIAKRLTESKQTVPHFYLTVDLNIDALLGARAVINEKGKDKYKISVNDLVIKAVAMSLRDVPAANASWTDAAILQYNNIDISVAVAIDGGLITPIIKNADQKSIVQISTEMKDLAKRAKENKLAPEEFQGGGFSISNLGMYGIKNFQAIVNPPQGCILAVGAGEQRAVVKNGQLTIANVMSCTLSVDHRVVDGAIGASLLQAFKAYIEEPVLMFV